MTSVAFSLSFAFPVPYLGETSFSVPKMDPSAVDADPSRDTLDPLSRHSSPAVGHHAAAVHARLCKNRRGWRRIVVNLAPAWFSVTMGTGITSILLYNLPYNGRWLYWASVVLFALNVAIFALLSVLSAVRYTLFPGIWGSMVGHPVQSLFLGTSRRGMRSRKGESANKE